MKKVYMIGATNSWVGRFTTDTKSDREDWYGEIYFIKIGVSGDPEKRLNELRTGNPAQLRLLHTCEFEVDYDANRVEKKLHHILDEGRCEGEWFISGPNAHAFSMVSYKRLIDRVRNVMEADVLVEWLAKHHNFTLTEPKSEPEVNLYVL